MPASHETQGESRPKRQRISRACLGCRTKRTKCDGVHPICGACNHREEQCEYPEGESKRKRPTNEYVHALEERVAFLEQELAQADRISARLLRSGESNSTTQDTPSSGKSNATEETDEVVEMLGRFTLGDAGDLRYFGAASSFNLGHNVPTHVASAARAQEDGLQAAQISGMQDVPNELRDHLLDLFWRWQNSWQVLVPQASFLDDLHTGVMGRYCTALLLRAILALASRYSDRSEVRTDPNDPNTAGAAFAADVDIMLHFEIRAPTISTIQAAALYGLYVNATDNESLAWLYAGIASRMSFSLGLHEDCSDLVRSGVLSRQAADARNLTWNGVYIVDRLFGLGMGRPSGILSSLAPAVPMPSVCFKEPDQHSNVPELMSLNTWHTSKLFEISSDALDRIYYRRPRLTTVKRDDTILQTYLQLTEFFNKLPQCLKISSSSLRPALPHVYQLHLQYHVTQILLHRHIFQRALKKSRGNPSALITERESYHSQVCTTAADKIAHIFRCYQSNYTLRCIPISAVHAAFTAGLVHLVDAKDPGNPNPSKSLNMLRLLVSSLYKMNIAWFWCNRSIMVIESLTEQWGVGLRDKGQAQQIDEESQRSFERYKLLVQGSYPTDATRERGVFSQPTSENTLEGMGFFDFGLDLDFFDLGRLYDDFCVPEGQNT
ncbi:hypothetical protein M438DRAFT_346475 [Aureobasidium pullulans EXF-150]|uniref:Zn(2)-C6 fungal-type domain-containing protein n=1 Tax=Aureobasidium pullulans EXF-150 TaxID=1043002 RepID=A0A074XDN9_AURPU|nr:uncharacterized protein M438DRAFT_346475 [Aureobasidium pullulans EXF-150]KEQ83528.1 hypothetical protein M438DRAFT_346475 [Aureobasidium pullulans EXF-150]